MHYETTDLDDPKFNHLLHTARDMFRQESLQVYTGYEDHHRRAWAEGDRAACGRSMQPWVRDVVHPATAQGRAMRRVHLIQVPITPYIAFEMECYRHSVAAGEDVRIIPVPWGSWPDSIPHGVVRRDFWRMDDTVADMHYDENGALERIVMTDDPERLAQARQDQAAAWGAATVWQNLWPVRELHKPR